MTEQPDSLLRKRWTSAVHTELNAPDTYQKVAVLIIRWHEAVHNDPQTKDEAEELESLFRDGFHYEIRSLVLDNSKRPQVLLDAAIAQSVADYDGPYRSHLLVVYYTGHGLLRAPDYDNLLIAGDLDAEEEEPYPPEAKWT
ncbi:hypothetical protein M409DRAFT_27265 [Zasmidium cellare ATCC 36951]|uniref:Uncharacterized protein n=1 Tax=Zasmidium cellare ATCC 36951 TaxID=1080233 RepID=A0A6A6C8P2_ZASCE|nr:uncharacterized protein M409DRAFT_27265 [Zasmidium cellare ATCC 36951]KAF2162262.1 hypothetical protein M409DRAFT_27265 [Zasmidium cellare ATCC 36951]